MQVEGKEEEEEAEEEEAGEEEAGETELTAGVLKKDQKHKKVKQNAF